MHICSVFHLGFVLCALKTSYLMLLLYVQLVFSLLWRHHSSIVVFASTSSPSTQCYPFLWVAWQNVVLEPMIFNYQNERHIVFDTFGLMLNLDSDEMLTTMKQSSTIKLLLSLRFEIRENSTKANDFIWNEFELRWKSTHARPIIKNIEIQIVFLSKIPEKKS